MSEGAPAMTPAPMSDEEIRRLSDAADVAWGKACGGPMPYELFAAALISARDAQLAAMIGEPVAAIHFAHKKPELRQLSWNLSAPNVLRAKGWIASPLYAIKETP